MKYIPSISNNSAYDCLDDAQVPLIPTLSITFRLEPPLDTMVWVPAIREAVKMGKNAAQNIRHHTPGALRGGN